MFFRIVRMFPSNNVVSHFLNQIMHSKPTIHNSYERFLYQHLYPYVRVITTSFKYFHCIICASPSPETCNIQEQIFLASFKSIITNFDLIYDLKLWDVF
ncbi:hypothetical protein Hanom_Chr07g00581381 [Helianthus anomalus]